MWFSPTRPGFESRLGNLLNFFFNDQVVDTWSMLTTCAYRKSRLAQLVERKTLNLVVVGSSPTVGTYAPVAQLAARRSHNPKVASSILAGSSYFFFPFWGTKSRFVFLCLPRWRFYRLDGRAVQGASLRH